MKQITQTQAQQLVSYQFVTKEQIKALLDNLRGTTFASIAYVTQVKTAAAHKALNIKKVTCANVQLFNNLNAATNVYENAVKRSAGKIQGQDAEAVANFTSAGNYFEHTDCYSIVKHKAQDKYYLFALFNSSSSVYMLDGKLLTKQEVAQYMTPAAAKELLGNREPTHNVGHDIEHNVICRTISMQSIVSIQGMGELVVG